MPRLLTGWGGGCNYYTLKPKAPSQQYNPLMYRYWLALLMTVLSTAALAEAWVDDGHQFFAEDELFQSSPAALRASSRKISSHIKYLKRTYLKELKDDFVIVFAPTQAADALFYPPKLYVDARGEKFKDAAVVINPRMLNNNRLYRLIGHELFHYVHDKKFPHEMSWVREGLAQNFEADVYGGITQSNLRSALQDSRHFLEEEHDASAPQPEKYGNTFLYFHFLEQYCLTEKAWKLVLNLKAPESSGRDTIEAILRSQEKRASFCSSAPETMGEFTLAKLINTQTPERPMALWPLLSALEPMNQEALVLAQLSAVELRRFFTELPPFLGFKLSANLWQPTTTGYRDITFYYWSAQTNTLTLWSERPTRLAPDASLIFFKRR